MISKAWIVAVIVLLAFAVIGIAFGTEDRLPMRSEAPLVYETPLNNAVILEFQLYDNETWCWLYLRKDVWEAIRANGDQIPADLDIGQLQCERR